VKVRPKARGVQRRERYRVAPGWSWREREHHVGLAKITHAVLRPTYGASLDAGPPGGRGQIRSGQYGQRQKWRPRKMARLMTTMAIQTMTIVHVPFPWAMPMLAIAPIAMEPRAMLVCCQVI